MKLSSKGQYAIKAMINLAVNYNNKPVTLTEISASHTISLSYLEQLFSILRSSGLVQGVRGPGGGYRLGKSPDQISVADIIISIEETANKTKREEDPDSEKCIANSLWDEFSGQFTTYLNSISLADIIKDQIVVKNQYQLDETTRRISTMFPVSAKLRVA
jgi:Rrf2 family iron-sulfur cluster assembly transcriptional regulator